MRVELNGESSEFAKLLLNIGDGILPENKTVGESMVELPTQLFIKTSSASELVKEVFPEFKNNFSDITWIKNRAILCPTNQECSEINKLLLEKLQEFLLFTNHAIWSTSQNHTCSPLNS